MNDQGFGVHFPETGGGPTYLIKDGVASKFIRANGIFFLEFDVGDVYPDQTRESLMMAPVVDETLFQQMIKPLKRMTSSPTQI